MVVSAVGLSFLVGLCPTVGMIGSSILLSNYEVGPKIEACFQNFAAGLIIAAVAGELFPIMANNSETNSVAGITIGFSVGLTVIFGLEKLVGYLENLQSIPVPTMRFERLANCEDNSTVNGIHDVEMSEEVPRRRTYTYPEGSSPEDMEDGEETSFESSVDDWEDEPVHRASIAIATPAHRGHIKEHLLELVATVRSMEDKSNELLERGNELSVREEEDIAEKIDEQVHSLQYKLDHVRRLLQGSESDVLFSHGDANTKQGGTSKWVTEDRKLIMKKKLSKLKSNVEHLVEHINEPNIDQHVLREMHEHMATMDRQIERFHHIVESNASKWRRNDALPQTQIGDKLPINLILPVTIDCFVDGFLIGVAVAISRKAGFILAAANFFEMSFLGMAYASRLVKCTGASVLMRNIALYAPPVVMFFSAGLGALMAATVQHIPVCYIAFVAFGVVALLFLVCNELLIEAKNAQGEEEKWWISLCIFLGIYMVLIVNQIVPGN